MTTQETSPIRTNNYAPQFPGRKLSTGICCLWRDHGRVYVEKITGSTATVRFDCNEGRRSRAHIAPVSQLDPEREWKFI